VGSKAILLLARAPPPGAVHASTAHRSGTPTAHACHHGTEEEGAHELVRARRYGIRPSRVALE
jgi:hypothetical protein